MAVAIAFTFGGPAVAQLATVGDYVKRMSSLDPKTLTKADCAAQVAKASSLNAADLFYASSICQAVHYNTEANFLLSVGQVRGSADMALMAPATKRDRDASAALYGFIFYYAGGPGNMDVLRTIPARDNFFALFDSWSPTLDAAYSPGWKVGKRPNDATYRKVLNEIKAGRRLQLGEMALLSSDEEYYRLQLQFEDLQNRTAGKYVEGTSEAKLATDLQQRMDRRAQALGIRSERADLNAEERNSPPSAPGKDESVIANSADPVAKQCSDWAENLVLMSLSKIVRVVMTTGSEWGLVWRADLASSDSPPEMSRFICSQHGTMLESGDSMGRPPLP